MSLQFIIIDSINHINITPKDLQKLPRLHPTIVFICILQAIKRSNFKASNVLEHDADISIKIENGKPKCMKNCYEQNLTKMPL